MRIGISINEVLRDFLNQLIYTYDKYIHETDLKSEEITDFDLTKSFTFDSSDELTRLNRFLYDEASLEVFGHADQLLDGLIGHVNHLIMNLTDEGHYVEIVGKEANKSIPSTLFFLSKTGLRAQNFRFFNKDVNEWDNLDVLITANPIALANKPSGKISVKVKAPYNAESTADFEIPSILELIKDYELQDRILNTKITTYEEIN